VLETTEGFHAVIEHILSGVPEWGVPQIMRKGNGLGEVFVEAQPPSYRPRNLCDLEAMGQPGPEKIALVIHEDLGLVLKPAKRSGMNDPVTIPLKLAAASRRGL
jgi:hypothetical protein